MVTRVTLATAGSASRGINTRSLSSDGLNEPGGDSGGVSHSSTDDDGEGPVLHGQSRLSRGVHAALDDERDLRYRRHLVDELDVGIRSVLGRSPV